MVQIGYRQYYIIYIFIYYILNQAQAQVFRVAIFLLKGKKIRNQFVFFSFLQKKTKQKNKTKTNKTKTDKTKQNKNRQTKPNQTKTKETKTNK